MKTTATHWRPLNNSPHQSSTVTNNDQWWSLMITNILSGTRHITPSSHGSLWCTAPRYASHPIPKYIVPVKFINAYNGTPLSSFMLFAVCETRLFDLKRRYLLCPSILKASSAVPMLTLCAGSEVRARRAVYFWCTSPIWLILC